MPEVCLCVAYVAFVALCVHCSVQVCKVCLVAQLDLLDSADSRGIPVGIQSLAYVYADKGVHSNASHPLEQSGGCLIGPSQLSLDVLVCLFQVSTTYANWDREDVDRC